MFRKQGVRLAFEFASHARVRVVTLGFDLKADELRTRGVPVFPQGIRVHEPRGVVRRVADDRDQK